MSNKQPSKNYLPKATANKGEAFFEQVYDLVRLIPKGRVTSYGAIANALGAKGSARMVGWAMNNCHHIKPKVPAHRVVNRNGLLTGKFHFGTGDEMQQLLEKEGVAIENNGVKDWNTLFWDPTIELGL